MDTVIELKTPEIVAQAHSGAAPAVPRTKESVDPKITFSIVEIDPQSSQFACELTITNVADEDFDVIAVRPRLPGGVKLDQALDSNEVELNKRYELICARVGKMMTNAIMASSKEVFSNEMKSMHALLKEILSIRNLFDFYFSIVSRRIPIVITEARKRQFTIDVTCYGDAQSAFQMFSSMQNAPEYDLILYNAGLLASIEQDEEFEKSRSQVVSLKKGQQYKVIYIVNGRRGSFNPTSFSISVDMLFQRGGYKVSRVEAATITVPPGPFWLSLIAMGASAIGSYIHAYSNAGGTSRPLRAFADIWEAISALTVDFAQQFAAPMLTALVVYNIFDMTSLRKHFAYRRSWRLAILIGFFCGFLNEKILAALSALFK